MVRSKISLSCDDNLVFRRADKCLLIGPGVKISNKEFFALLFVLLYSQYSKDRDTSTFFVHMTNDDVIFMNN